MHEYQLTTRFSETDALGHINNTSYFIYLEDARIGCLGSLGYQLNSSNWHYVVASVKCDFTQQAYFNENLTIQSYVSNIGTKSFQLEHDIIRSETKQLIAKGSAVVVYFNFETQQSEELPKLLRKRLETLLK
ncbi:acyl-CoA thioesterase [Bacillaceae bacterium Marseille-Q3522]|nr:acyl-CoA thioesterase [Bacillaceae bacterium Marseille-Q3522]